MSLRWRSDLRGNSHRRLVELTGRGYHVATRKCHIHTFCALDVVVDMEELVKFRPRKRISSEHQRVKKATKVNITCKTFTPEDSDRQELVSVSFS